jgi:hypothetical protein
VDAEGFTIRPKDVWEAEDNGKFYSSSDTDSGKKSIIKFINNKN